MAIVVSKPDSSGLGAVVEGLDPGALTPAVEDLLRRAYRDSPVLCIRGGPLSPNAYLRLARVFGTPQVQLLREFRDQAHPEISYVESGQHDTRGDGKKIAFGAHWHTDDSYMAKPCSSTLLYGQIVPPVGGDTLFTNMYRAYEALDGGLKTRIATLRAVHAYQSRRNVSAVPTRSAEEAEETPEVSHPLLRTHPETGRKAIYINLNRIERVDGLSIEEGDTLLDALSAHATKPAFIYAHKWRVNDVLIWDNRCTMHKASPDYGEHHRRMARILIEGTAPV